MSKIQSCHVFGYNHSNMFQNHLNGVKNFKTLVAMFFGSIVPLTKQPLDCISPYVNITVSSREISVMCGYMFHGNRISNICSRFRVRY